MLDQVIRLDTVAGRALYRFINTLVPQSVVGSVVYGLNQTGEIPLDADILTVTSVALGAIVTAADKYRRDRNESVIRSGEVRENSDGQLHYNPPR